MLTNLKIEKFRGFSELSLTDAGRVNLIVGRNDTGKTSLLEAIRLLLTADPRNLNRKTRSRVARRPLLLWQDYYLAFHQLRSHNGPVLVGEVNSIKLTLRAEIRNVQQPDALAFHPDSNDGAGEDGDAFDGGESLLQPSQEIVFNATANGEARAEISQRLRRGSPVGRLFTGATFPKIPPVTWLGTDRAEVWPLARRYSDLFRSGGSNTLVELLRQLEPQLVSLVMLTSEHNAIDLDGAVLEADLGFDHTLPIDSMGDGFGSIISILSAIGTAKGGLCLIDEIENGIHYSVLPNLWRTVVNAAKQYDAQVWATTHSFDCLSAIYGAFCDAPDELRVHRLDRRSDGSVIVHTFDHVMLGHALEQGLEVR